jgi:hypothetical protein
MKALVASAAAIALLYSVSALAGDELTVRVPAPSSYSMHRSEFRDYAAIYDLSNGQTIRFTEYRKHFFAQLGDEPKTEMYAIAPGALVTASGTRFEFSNDGSEVTIRNYEKLPLAGVPGGSNITVIAWR